MRLTRATALTSVASAVLAASLTGCNLTTDSAPAGPIVIGADLELSGSAAAVGKAFERALRLKTEQLNAAGVAGGRKLELRVRDNRSDSRQSLKNLGEFGDDSTVAAVITGSCSQCLIAAHRTVESKKLPTIALAPATDVTTPVAERQHIFKIAPNAVDSAAALAGHLEELKAKKVALLLNDDPYAKDGEAAMRAELTKAQIDVVAAPAVKVTDTDLSGAVRTAITDKPDALVVWTFAEQAALAASAAKAQNFEGDLLFDAGAADDLFLAEPAATAAEGVMMVFTQTMVIDDVIATTPTKAARKQWFRDYTSRYGSYSGHASFAADALQLLADGLDRVGGVDRDRLREVVETSQLDGLSGPIRMTPDNHSGLMPQALTMLVVRGGRWRLAA
ncbi:MAG TPA: ABC transporter substrate-binding protein [Pilimelia sp.]|nr:ABC transporter substrate-binding protein [Pilimelia sp.]